MADEEIDLEDDDYARDNVGRDEEEDDFDWMQDDYIFPQPLSPTREIELMRTEVTISGPCWSNCVCFGEVVGLVWQKQDSKQLFVEGQSMGQLLGQMES